MLTSCQNVKADMLNVIHCKDDKLGDEVALDVKKSRAEKDRIYRERNGDAIRARDRKRYKRNKEKKAAYQKEYVSRPGVKERRSKLMKRWKQENKAAVSEHHYRNRYGISSQDVELMNKQQKGFCGICGESKKLFVDHCHNSNKVRGLLCHTCNTGLGLFKESIQSFEAAIQYLQKY